MIRVQSGILVIYDAEKKQWEYPRSTMFLGSAGIKEAPWEVLMKDQVLYEEDAEGLKNSINSLLESEDSETGHAELITYDEAEGTVWYVVQMVKDGSKLYLSFQNVNERVQLFERIRRMTEYDRLTGLMKREFFMSCVEKKIAKDRTGVENGEYAMCYLDINRFKAINEMFGSREGDRLLSYIGSGISKLVGKDGLACRIGADRFLFFVNKKYEDAREEIKKLLKYIGKYNLGMDITCNIGYYMTDDPTLAVEAMADRAVMALNEIKGHFSKRHNSYKAEMREALLREQAIVGEMKLALEQGQFVPFYQPQYNHITGNMVGAEALLRWIHPIKGVLSPGRFINIFEKTGFITEVDLDIFEQVCVFQKNQEAAGKKVVPVSINLSRHDIYNVDFLQSMEEIRNKHQVPTNYLRIEITEADIMGDSNYINEFVAKLHDIGYIVEMDDFGSGYSSLNVLKDINMDVLKLDMKFFTDADTPEKEKRGRCIISAMVNMAKQLNMPVIAEGVETEEQADFLKSIGAGYIQGFYYSKPLPEQKLLQKMEASEYEEMI